MMVAKSENFDQRRPSKFMVEIMVGAALALVER
jgi:hypothetical protein